MYNNKRLMLSIFCVSDSGSLLDNVSDTQPEILTAAR